MTITQRFTTMGVFGVIFVFAGPLIVGAGYWQWISYVKSILAQPYSPVAPPFSVLALAFIGGILSLASLPMMIIGREFTGTTIMTSGRLDPR
ncbi:hypothetical protein [Agrobacterium tumefaciens]|uniref:hypothetical protein n=1 Tax=Agrobacterium tumefaciens TaxID=358 RepID=UPI003B9E71C8